MAQDYEAFYLRVGSVPCPKFNGERITFNRTGLNHLIRKHGKRRLKSDRERRFALLQYAPGIIANPRAEVISRKTRRANFWMFKEEKDGRTVKVIVRQLSGGKKHFYSIFANKKKPPSA